MSYRARKQTLQKTIACVVIVPPYMNVLRARRAEL